MTNKRATGTINPDDRSSIIPGTHQVPVPFTSYLLDEIRHVFPIAGVECGEPEKKKRKKEENRKDACHVDFHILSLMGTDTPAEMTRHARRRADYESKCFRMRKRVGGGAEEKDAGHVACPRRRESEPFRIPLKTVTFSRIALARRTSDDKLRTARATSDK